MTIYEISHDFVLHVDSASLTTTSISSIAAYSVASAVYIQI